MSNVIDTYKIKFVTRNFNGSLWNVTNSTNAVLSQLIGDYKTPDEVNNFLISEINNVLNGSIASETIISESMISANLSLQTTGLYQDPDYDPSSSADFELPTSDLLLIAKAWLNYITLNPAGNRT